MPVPRLPSLRLPLEPLQAHRKNLTPAESLVRDAAVAALAAAEQRYVQAVKERLDAITAALEAHATIKAAAAVIGLTETALAQRLAASRRRHARSPE
jgi:hypothetical protein